MMSYGNAFANPGGGVTTNSISSNTTTINDPYLQNDFYPLQQASSEILVALRSDESAPDADLYRRLISSSGVGAHRYHRVEGDGLGRLKSSSSLDNQAASSGAGGGGRPNKSDNNGVKRPSQQQGGTNRTMMMGSNVIGSPLGVLRGARNSSTASSSNNNERDNYNNTTDDNNKLRPPSQPPTPYLQHDKSLPLPTYLANEVQKANLSSLMGLLPDANLVWLTRDDTLFLWSYDTSSSTTTTPNIGNSNNNNNELENYCSFTVPSGQCIVSVALVHPKSNVFNMKFVEWCIVVTTPEEVILCALAKVTTTGHDEQHQQENGDSFNGDSSSSSNSVNGGFRHGNGISKLIPTRFILPTDSIPLTSIVGSKAGRIFMGGVDGCVYEMTYEGNSSNGGGGGSGSGWSGSSSSFGFGGGGSNNDNVMERAIDDYFDGRGIFIDNNMGDNSGGVGTKLTEQVVVGGKRMLSALTFGSLDSSTGDNGDDNNGYYHGGEQRRSKCRKINHSSTAPGLVASVVPGAIVRAASGIFASSSESAARKGGPIVSMILDEERHCLYTLSSKGKICAYDLCPPPNNGSNTTAVPRGDFNAAVAVTPPRLACVFDSVASAKLYLDSVSRGRMYPPTTSHSIELGTITFPGGNAAAMAGVGGMDGARAILKRHDQEMRAVKASAAGSSSKAIENEMSNSTGILHPVSINLVPSTESKSLTLVAVTGGGLRYYISSLASQYISTAHSSQGTFADKTRGLDPKLVRTRPGRKMTFCHIRAPPPYTSGDGNDGFRFELAPSAVNELAGGGTSVGIPPGIHDRQSLGSARKVSGAVGDVVKGYYKDGIFMLALDVDKSKSKSDDGSSRGISFPFPSRENSSTRKTEGDAIVSVLPDFAARVVTADSFTATTNTSNNLSLQAPGGISESISLPLTGYEGTKSPVLPGGRTFDIATSTNMQSSLVSLFMNSETPTDGELQIGLTPSFVPPKIYRRRNNQSGTSSSLVVSYDKGNGVFSSALSALSNYIRSGQGYGFEVPTVSSNQNDLSPTVSYRVSRRHGCDAVGFSRSAEESLTARNGLRGKSTPRAANKSERLPSWLLRPSAAPLNCQAAQHLSPIGSGSTLVLNTGGLHMFNYSSLLNNLASALLRATNIENDDTVRNFFVSYGKAEGCAMCFLLAASSSSSASLRRKAEDTAKLYAQRPEMKLTGPSKGDGMDPITSFTFQPSSLYEGLVKCLSRLLRPIWYKPAAVVTEGRPIQRKSPYANYYDRLPAKVELLLDDSTLDEIRRPLLLLQELMKSNFSRQVKRVPGVTRRDSSDQMDVDEGDSSPGLITGDMQKQRRAMQHANNASQTQYASGKERQAKAEAIEDRNMHSAYRLLSRSVQVLNLLSCLKQAHANSRLPEVQWGLLHGLTFNQLVTSQEGQQRIETLLNELVSQGDRTLLNRISQDGDRLAQTLSSQCYLFFSSASRLTYMGFSVANEALSLHASSQKRVLLINKAASFLRAASRHWYDPALVAGRINNRTSGSESWIDRATCAFEAGSPLARAAEVLMELENTDGMAMMCLTCAANFGGVKVSSDDGNEFEGKPGNTVMDWEKGLYHRPVTASTDTSASGTQSIVPGIDVTPADALKTCHSIPFYYLTKLLNDGGSANQKLAEKLLAACASSSDVKFLHSMYEHLLSTNQVETVLRLDSTSLENWLINEKKDNTLLWRYYTFHNRHVSAGEIMLKKAVDPNEKIPLAQRIECLTRAANSYSSASNSKAYLPSSNLMQSIGGYSPAQDRLLKERQVSDASLKANINEIQDKLDVASIQQRVLTTVEQSQNVDLDAEKLSALGFALLSPTDLYNEYACPLSLFDVCLLIMNTCHTNQSDTIETLWKSVICEETIPCQTTSALAVSFLTQLKQGSTLEDETVMQSGDYGNNLQSFDDGEWIPRLRNRVSTLGKELYGKGADYTVPLDLIVQALEGLRQSYNEIHKENQLSNPWPIETILSIGFSFDALYRSYDSLYLEADGDINWLASVLELLKIWVNDAFNYDSLPAGSVGSSASSQLAQAVKNGGLIDRIRTYIAALDGMDGAIIDELKIGFSEVEDAIRKGF